MKSSASELTKRSFCLFHNAQRKGRELECGLISLGVCTISLSKQNANGSYLPGMDTLFPVVVLCFRSGAGSRSAAFHWGAKIEQH